MDIIYLFGHPVLQILYEGTRFGAAVRLLSHYTDHICYMLIRCWASIYTEMTNRIIGDQGTSFGPSFIRLDEHKGVKVEHTGIDAHNRLGFGERYHQTLSSTLRKMFIAHPKENFDLALCLAIKSNNDTLGPD